ncbi:MAG: hypothetical protein GY820_38080 [Gammaproteobacteria bacterium]|nr:hypothetical protein [Gammaproteobacteria bacterium]
MKIILPKFFDFSGLKHGGQYTVYTRNLENGEEIFPHELLLIFITAVFVRYYKNNDANSESYANELNAQAINLTNLVKNSTEAMCNMVGFENVSFKKSDPSKNSKKSFSRRNESKRILNDLKKLLDENRNNLQYNKGWKSFLNQCISTLADEIIILEKENKNENLIVCLKSVKSMYRNIIFLTSIWNIDSNCNGAILKNTDVLKLKIMRNCSHPLLIKFTS